MKRRALLVFFLVWVLGGLACMSLPLPAVDLPYQVTEPALELPTPAPTPAPPPAGAPVGETLTFTGSGTKLDFSSDKVSCQVPATATLVLDPDGAAELTTTGMDITDHYNCKGDHDETWYIDGTAGMGKQEVTFTTCNFGGFTAQGQVLYSSNRFQGMVSCLNKDGTLAVSLEFK